ncbi:hypothetical protein ABH973_006711 [Bradyrhizobium ottawaense]
MNDTKSDNPESTPRSDNEARQNDLRRLIEEYAADLRAIIRKLRQKLN